MSIRITQKQLISASIILFVFSVIFLEYSKMFRMNKELHWIYSSGHNWWLFIAMPVAFWGSIILGGYSLGKVKNNKISYFLFSLLPLILFVIFISV